MKTCRRRAIIPVLFLSFQVGRYADRALSATVHLCVSPVGTNLTIITYLFKSYYYNCFPLFFSLHRLFTGNSFDFIDEDAFMGLPHLEYLYVFICFSVQRLYIT